jgi:hypothetical protein
MSVILGNGTATIPAGQTFVVVNHGISSTPSLSQIGLTPQDDLGGRSYWPSNPAPTTFQINIGSEDVTNHMFSWFIVGVGAPAAGAAYITTSDVQEHLNATYDAVKDVYTVYGLNIAGASFLTHVTFANNYVVSLLGTIITSDDRRYETAWMAALDVACIRILVVSMGGSLVGAYDYFLGDLRVSRAGPYATAMKQSIVGFREDLAKQIINLTSPVMTQEAAAAGEVPTYKGGLINP